MVPLGPVWADLVFHVLAHASSTAGLASSLYDAGYVAHCERYLGPISARALGTDLEHLGQVLTSHETLARVQCVAFLFDDPAGARAAVAKELSNLTDAEVRLPRALHALADVEPIAELLRAAAELEAPHHARLPAVTVDAALGERLDTMAMAAPYLKRLDVACLRALGRRGRVSSPTVWVGVPMTELGVTAESVAVQAAHEATVAEVAERSAVPLAERDVEHAALVLFAERAREAGLDEAHERWWESLSVAPLRNVEAALTAAARDVVQAALRSVT